MVAPAPRLAHDCRLCLVRDGLAAKFNKAYAAYQATGSDYFRGYCHGYEDSVNALDKALDCQIVPLHVARDELDRGENANEPKPLWPWLIAVGAVLWFIAK